jgi:hypothetical protein
MRTFSVAALASAAIIGLAATAVAARQPIRVRGEIQSVRGNTLNVSQRETDRADAEFRDEV